MPTPDWVSESLFALDLLSSRHRQAKRRLRWHKTRPAGPARRLGPAHRLGSTQRLVELARTIRPFPDLDAMVRRARRTGDDADTRLLRDLESFYRIVVAPHWDVISLTVQSDRKKRLEILHDCGARGLLSTLHPAVRLSTCSLEIPGQSEDVQLEECGLTIAPSYFLAPDSPVLVDDHTIADGPTLFYPILPDGPACTTEDAIEAAAMPA
ncbi:hypothetical protein P3T27_006366 [Kitasatospora sp. MAA19]|uniref:hypothetical protein n=1 Tax=unclassified Kitasatospora TaxID=2633591 RepID=UPI00247398CD|nr:hypothetical protein [Kitasatospora sp. MAA19]MDH6709618.1 hypothetical protein [Kitasatospora sp. MAA19]